MNLISYFLKKIFGNNYNQGEIIFPPVGDYGIKWGKGKEEKMKIIENRLKGWLIEYLKEKNTLSFTWESGGDEAFVTVEDKDYIDNDIYNSEHDFDLEDYIIDKLNIPDAGEFQMNGSGIIYMENNFVKVKYSSTMRATIDFDEKTGEEIFSEEELDSGNKVLFECF